eukprot:TRINITY_DN12611_c0_g1_i1.p1 TRINITY_DN12611_c0_g1~~TRINITY_DN12611_c0_g1_i1.p1  ORF type:complete len:129 (+),score=27.43 TRINITY_DN12611_c0_g1_i1:82-468(+)
MNAEFEPAAKSVNDSQKEVNGKYKVDVSGWSSDDCPNSPILTDNDCMLCGEEAQWSCKPCDAKYCNDCWDKDHQTVKHEKTTFKYKTSDTNGKVTLSNATTATEVLGRGNDEGDGTANSILSDFLGIT